MVVTRMSRSALAGALVEAIDALAATADGKWFAKDVLEEFPDLEYDYTRIVGPHRMDLGKMKKKCTGYVDVDSVMSDVQRIVDNCVAFNGPQSEYSVAAGRFATDARNRFETIFAQYGAAPEIPITEGSRTSTSSSAHHSTSPAAAGHNKVLRLSNSSGGSKRPRDEEGHNNNNINSTPVPPIPQYQSTAALQKRKRQLLDLIASFERKVDEGLFSHDVVSMYPSVALDYDAVCPTRMDLDRMRAKVDAGAYHYLRHSDGSELSSNRLSDVTADVQHIVDNCCRYNGEASVYGNRALDFLAHCQRLIAAFESANGITAAAVAAGGSANPRSRGAAPVSSPSAVVAPPRHAPPPQRVGPTFGLVAPDVAPSPWQLQLTVPPSIRSFIIDAHLHRETQRCRMLSNGDGVGGDIVDDKKVLPRLTTVRTVVAAFLACLQQQQSVIVDEAKRDLSLQLTTKLEATSETGTAEASTVPIGNEPQAAAETSPAAATSSSAEDVCLKLLSAHKKKVLIRQCEHVLRILLDVFEASFENMLLYPLEHADVDAFLAQQKLLKTERVIAWADLVSVAYFIRLIVWFPSLGVLLCSNHSSSNSKRETASDPSKVPSPISTALDVASLLCMNDYVIPVLEHFLLFVEAHHRDLLPLATDVAA